MKQKDIALIIIVAGISGFASFFISHLIFVSPTNRQQKAETVDTITADFPTPNNKYFNSNSIDPAQVIQVTNGNNPNPFNGAQ